MADVTMVATSVALLNQRGMRGTVFATPLKGYHFYVDSNSDLSYIPTTDGGQTWGTPVVIQAETVETFDVWFDKWTPGDTGATIHIWMCGLQNDLVQYFQLNTINNVVSASVTVLAAASIIGARGVFISGAKMRGGNLVCVFDLDAFAEHGTYKSVNNGASWTSQTEFLEATIDQGLMFPGNDADPNDAWMLYQDASTDELTLKVFDDSANTVSESSVISGMIENTTDGTGQYGFTGSVRHSDGHLIIAVCTDFDTVTEDFRVFDITNMTTITEKTALATDKDDIYYPQMYIDQSTNNLYVSYVGKLDGTETLRTTASVYYAKSTDGGVTWTTNILYSATGSDWAQTWGPISGPRFTVVWFKLATVAVLTNFDNSLQLGPDNTLNNYQFAKATGVGNTGIISLTEKIR